MFYALDLNPRQSARTLEQALRHEAAVVLRPRGWAGRELRGRLVKGGSGGLVAAIEAAAPDGVAPGPEGDPAGLVGRYCDLVLEMGDNRYLFSSEILQVDRGDTDGGACVHLVRPEGIQVAQRRRTWRFHPVRSMQIELRWVKDAQGIAGGIGWLCNISGEGLACRTDVLTGDQLLIGDRLTASFTLSTSDSSVGSGVEATSAGRAQRQAYRLEAVLCNKTPASPGRLILGLQFLTGPGFESNVRTAQALREHLLTQFAHQADAGKGADR